MIHNKDANLNLDSGLISLALIARFHGLPADPQYLSHQNGYPGQQFDSDQIVLAARSLGLKARLIESNWDRLPKTTYPAIAQYNNGRFVIVAAFKDNEVLVQDPLEKRPLSLSRQLFEEYWNRRLILFTRRSVLGQASRIFNISWFIPVFIRYRKLFTEVLIASFFIQLFALITPLFFQVIIDKVLVHKGLTTLDVLAIGLLGLSLFEIILAGLRGYIFSHTTSRVDVILGSKLYKHLLALPLSYFEARRVGDSVARVHELDNIRQFLSSSALTLLIDSLFAIIFLAVLYFYSPLLTTVVAASIPVYIILSVVITPMLRSRLEDKFAKGAENQAFLVESVSGVQTLKSMAVEPQLQQRWEEQLASYIKSSFKAKQIGNIANQVAGFVNKVSVVLILWIGASLVMKGDLSVGKLIAFNMIAGRISGPVLRLVQLWQDFQQAGISVKRLGDILNTPTEPGYKPGRTTLPDLIGDVRFEHVGFRYTPDRPTVLNDITFRVKPGEVIGIVGRSGSGKSTLTKLIQRLYVPESGRVLIDGVDLALVEPAWLRRQIGVVLQENFLLNRSVRENIVLADPGISMDKVIKAAKLAGAHDFILELPEGYDTLVGEHGGNLSGGQRQRIAIARALIADPGILIFDEATSALDYESERIIQQNMQAISQGRTVFIIAHRLTAVRHSDRILVVDKGRIIEDGNHEQLLNNDSGYALMHALQMGGA